MGYDYHMLLPVDQQVPQGNGTMSVASLPSPMDQHGDFLVEVPQGLPNASLSAPDTSDIIGFAAS